MWPPPDEPRQPRQPLLPCSDDRKPIDPNPPRFRPSADPNSIMVPGLDKTAPINDQIDYIEQLITVKLQNIDANVAKVNHLLATRMLPAFKKYAVGTEPVRDAAKLWVNFFEKAARVRLPIYDDLSAFHEQPAPSIHDDEDSEESHQESIFTESEADITARQGFDPNETPSESSFMPGQGAISSTPATISRHRASQNESFASHASDETPWASSLESPLHRLDRQIQSLSLDDGLDIHDPTPSQLPSTSTDQPTTQPRDKGKGKSKDVSQPLLQNLLRQQLVTKQQSGSSAGGPLSEMVSPLKLRRKPTTPKAMNPFIPPNSKPESWDGLVDLSHTPLSTPRRRKTENTRHQPSTNDQSNSAPNTHSSFTNLTLEEDDEDDDDWYPPGMSPMKTIALPAPPRSMKELGLVPSLGKTPKKEAAHRIGQDLIGDLGRRGGGEIAFTSNSSMSTLPTPPSISRYTRAVSGGESDRSESNWDASLDSLMRRVGLTIQGYETGQDSIATSHNNVSPASLLPSGTEAIHTPEPNPGTYPFAVDDQTVTPGRYPEEEEDSLEQEQEQDSLDSLDNEEFHNTANPSAAFIMASQRRPGSESFDDDDSFGSSNHSSDSLSGSEGEGVGGLIHPFARAGAGEDDGFDDSFDDDDDDVVHGGLEAEGPEEETVFGVRPAERRPPAGSQQLRMLGQDLLEDTVGLSERLEGVGESPTPWSGRIG
ncbi:hypothetical protein JAAARDRAFT_538132 [Jaapia argillacea MUCL 33604]|uniref:DASH complex subunit ASK1 n=1 Tax=Jaapia argillacea MUCL 33604 TaxID=933084 RepID=A0A067PBB3_9AGAM|nr:hypothetical protein JAAARDRAFT_538132 [Jaapia argillacea MUCL 33604]